MRSQGDRIVLGVSSVTNPQSAEFKARYKPNRIEPTREILRWVIYHLCDSRKLSRRYIRKAGLGIVQKQNKTNDIP